MWSYNLKAKAIPEVAEPLDQLGSVILVELDIWEEDLDDRRAGVAVEEEHQLGLAQVHGCEGGGVVRVKEITR